MRAFLCVVSYALYQSAVGNGKVGHGPGRRAHWPERKTERRALRINLLVCQSIRKIQKTIGAESFQAQAALRIEMGHAAHTKHPVQLIPPDRLRATSTPLESNVRVGTGF